MPERSPSTSEIRVRVADVTVRVASAGHDGPTLCMPEMSRKFEATTDDAVDLDLSARWGDLSTTLLGEPLFDSGGTWKLYR